MREFLGLSAGMALLAGSALAAPLVPRIESHDFNFGGFEPTSQDDDESFYAPRGEGADWLTLLANENDREVTAFWEVWPIGIPVPVFNGSGNFGGDIQLALEFDGHDENPPHLDVSLTGKGRRQGADLNIFGTLTTTGGKEVSGLLLSIDVEEAALYGFGNSSSFVLETAGKILFIDPELDNPLDTLVGDSAVSRGNIDFRELALKSGYDPLSRDNGQNDLFNDGGGYSGEVGAGFVTVPEPATLVLLVSGLMLGLRRK